MRNSPDNVIGLLPAAGLAERIAPLPVSKELYPIGFSSMSGRQGLRPKVAAQYLLERMRLAGAEKAFIILRNGKWDIPSYFGDGYSQNMHLAYLIMRQPFGVPYTLDEAYPFIRSATIVFGFPDIVFYPKEAYVKLLHCLTTSDADISLAIFKARQPEKMDMVALGTQDRILRIVIKPKRTRLTHTWIAAAWKPNFTTFLHEFVTRDSRIRAKKSTVDIASAGELHIGEVIHAALASKLKAVVVRFDSGSYLDIGIPENLVAAPDFVQAAENESTVAKGSAL